MAASVMRIQAIVDGKASIASGVALTSHLTVTNCHVVGNSLATGLICGSLSSWRPST